MQQKQYMVMYAVCTFRDTYEIVQAQPHCFLCVYLFIFSPPNVCLEISPLVLQR